MQDCRTLALCVRKGLVKRLDQLVCKTAHLDGYRVIQKEIDHPHAATLTSAGGCEPQFTHAASSWNPGACHRILSQEINQFAPFVLVEEPVCVTRERRGLRYGLQRHSIYPIGLSRIVYDRGRLWIFEGRQASVASPVPGVATNVSSNSAGTVTAAGRFVPRATRSALPLRQSAPRSWRPPSRSCTAWPA